MRMLDTRRSDVWHELAGLRDRSREWARPASQGFARDIREPEFGEKAPDPVPEHRSIELHRPGTRNGRVDDQPVQLLRGCDDPVTALIVKQDTVLPSTIVFEGPLSGVGNHRFASCRRLDRRDYEVFAARRDESMTARHEIADHAARSWRDVARDTLQVYREAAAVNP
jgi:hypothetical protein